MYVHVDTRHPGVLLPDALLNRPQVCLQLSAPLHTDLAIDSVGWCATLSFGSAAKRQSFFSIIPWDAVYLVVGESGVGAGWPSDTPKEAVIRDAEGNVKRILDLPKPALEAPAERLLPAGWRVIDGGLGKPVEPPPKLASVPKSPYPKPGRKGPYRRPSPDDVP